VGNAGTVSTGAVDPLEDLAAIAREHDLWFHVDGAYGAFAAATPDAPPQLAGMHQADSVAVDPHKWLYVPLEAGCALVRDPDALRDAFSFLPPYYRFSEDADEPRTHYYQLGFQNSRGFRALKVWMGLRQVGRAGYARMIADDMRLARALHAEVAGTAELQALTCSLSITTFRYLPADLEPGDDAVDAYLDTLNEELLRRLKDSGALYLTNAMVHGDFALRACIVNFRTALDDILAVPTMVVQQGRTTDAELRPPELRPARTGQP
jgi:glutamate/tyrosine decarboxylase-like PLP-dependent enzyme